MNTPLVVVSNELDAADHEVVATLDKLLPR